MKKSILHIIISLIVMGGCIGRQNNPVARMEDGRIIYRFDTGWDRERRMEVAKRYELDSAIIEEAYGLVPGVKIDSAGWTMENFANGVIEMSKKLGEDLPVLKNNDVFLVDDGWVRRDEIMPEPDVVFGYNQLKNNEIFSYKDSTATFFLKGHENASEVYISGSFNDWSTMQMPMEKTTGGWTIKIKLDPGKYAYKFIVDGRWMTDQNNLLKERENGRGVVSVIYCTNHIFRLSDEADRKWSNVVVTGSFISWNRRGIRMIKEDGNWTLPVYFRDGTYSYKFIADNMWMADPANPDKRLDVSGNENSFLSIGDKYWFSLRGFTEAGKVVLSGSFNMWSTSELVMVKDGSGWVLDYAIPSGMYEYKFIVDGQWMPDPHNPFTSGTGNYVNSVLAVRPDHTFSLEGFSNAREVIVTGSFKGWSPDGYRMVKKDGKWIFPIYLKPGKYLYKFIVDKKWILDPANDLWEENEYGTGNSVLWISR